MWARKPKLSFRLNLKQKLLWARALDTESATVEQGNAQLVERFYPDFERVYESRYQGRYGFWRPTCPPKPRRRRVIARAVERFLDCGDLKKGFAWVRCP